MNTHFITLPSGLRVNTAFIRSYRYIRESDSVGYTEVIMTDGELLHESISKDEMDAKLSPPQSPIVSPVLELRMPRKGDAVQFTDGGKVRHGVVTLVSLSHDHDEYSFVEISSSGDFFRYFPDSDREPDRIQ